MNTNLLTKLPALAVAAVLLTACGEDTATTSNVDLNADTASDTGADAGNLLTTKLPQERIEGTPLPMKAVSYTHLTLPTKA